METKLTGATIAHPNRTRVLLDCDGVLSDFVGRFLDVVNQQNGTSYRHEDVTEFDIAAALRLTQEQRAAVNEVVNAPGFATGLNPLPGAGAGVRQLQQIAEVYIVTSPWYLSRTWEYDRRGWLWSWLGISAKHVIPTSAKHVCSGDVLVDDKTSTCVTWQTAHPRGIAVQWQTPHNRRDGWTSWSTKSWDELVRFVEAFANGVIGGGLGGAR